MDDERHRRSHDVEVAVDPSQPRLPADRAFVVQFRRLSDALSAEPAGRVEHLVSGAATTFTAWDELRSFVEFVLEGVASRQPLSGG